MKIVGWDIGGANLKASIINFKNYKIKSNQIYCPIWLNIENLRKSIICIKNNFGHCDYHAVTMTAELVDVFKNKKIGVKKIIELFCKIFPEKKVFFYSKNANFLKRKDAILNHDNVSSMNWHASATFISKHIKNCMLVDIGSSTTDIVPIKNKEIIVKGFNDSERLSNGELIYFGVLRTPITSVVKKIHFKRKKQILIQENFADIADVYRVLNKLPKNMDVISTQDKKPKNPVASARRIARLLAKDYEDEKFKEWKKISIEIESAQKKIILNAIQKIKKKIFKNSVPIIGLGVGSFLIKEIYNNKNYFPFNKTLKNFTTNKKLLNCETAVSVAFLLYSNFK